MSVNDTWKRLGEHATGWLHLVWPFKLNPPPDWRINELYQMLWAFGIEATWEAASRCVCGTWSDQAARQDCPICHGDGWEFHHSQPIRTAMVGVRTGWTPYDRNNPMTDGSAQFSVRGEHVPAPGDRITLLGAHITMTDRYARMATIADPIERLRYPVYPQEVETRDPETGRLATVALGVIHLRAADADGKAKLDSHGHPYTLVEGTDFDVTEDGYLDWTKGDVRGTAPEAPETLGGQGSGFSIYYKTRPVFRVTDHSHALRASMTRRKRTAETLQVLPCQFTAKLEWLLAEGA